jgi:Flp pilus assembly protein TadD
MGWNENTKMGQGALIRGDYVKAERFFSGALADAQKLGKTDPRLAQSLNDLAMMYHSLGRLTEAEPLYRKAIAIDEKRGDQARADIAVTHVPSRHRRNRTALSCRRREIGQGPS